MEKKKKTRLGEVETKDIVKSKASTEVNDTTLITDKKKAGYGSIGGYDTFGESKTKSLGRAMQENKTQNVGADLASKMTEAALERMKKKKK